MKEINTPNVDNIDINDIDINNIDINNIDVSSTKKTRLRTEELSSTIEFSIEDKDE